MEINIAPKPFGRGRGRGRPAQPLYMPPARRNREVFQCDDIKSDIKQQNIGIETKIMEGIKEKKRNEAPIFQAEKFSVNERLRDLKLSSKTTEPEDKEDFLMPLRSIPQIMETAVNTTNQLPERRSDVINKFPIVSLSPMENKRAHQTQVQTADNEKDNERKAKAINVKVRDVKCDVLQISVAKNIKKSPIKLVQVDQWEDLFNDEEGETTQEDVNHKDSSGIGDYDDLFYEDDDIHNSRHEHILEIYDFPSTFKTADIMQIYSELDQNSIYIKWLNETRALLVLGSAIQAKRALSIENPLIKARPVALGSQMALDMVWTCNLRPAMKRPQTSMQAARRMITTALGAKSSVSREVQQREREALRKAKEERRTQRQNERDAWEGNPRPTTV